MNPLLRKTLPFLALAAAAARRPRSRRPLQGALRRLRRRRRSRHLAVVRRRHAHQPRGAGLRHPAVRHSAGQLLRQAVLPGEPRARRDALRERREYLQPDRDARLRPRVLQPPRSAERDRAGAAVAARRSAVRPRATQSISRRPPPHDLPGRTGMAVPLPRFHRPGQCALRSHRAARGLRIARRGLSAAGAGETVAGGQHRPDVEERGERRLLLRRDRISIAPTARSIRSSS